MESRHLNPGTDFRARALIIIILFYSLWELSALYLLKQPHLPFARCFFFFSSVFHSKYFREITKNPHTLSWTNLLTVLQYFLPVTPFLVLLSLYPCPYLWSSPVVICENAEVYVKDAVSCCSESHWSSGSEQPGTHAERVMNFASTLGVTLSPQHWNSTAYGWHFEKALKNSFCSLCL